MQMDDPVYTFDLRPSTHGTCEITVREPKSPKSWGHIPPNTDMVFNMSIFLSICHGPSISLRVVISSLFGMIWTRYVRRSIDMGSLIGV